MTVSYSWHCLFIRVIDSYICGTKLVWHDPGCSGAASTKGQTYTRNHRSSPPKVQNAPTLFFSLDQMLPKTEQNRGCRARGGKRPAARHRDPTKTRLTFIVNLKLSESTPHFPHDDRKVTGWHTGASGLKPLHRCTPGQFFVSRKPSVCNIALNGRNIQKNSYKIAFFGLTPALLFFGRIFSWFPAMSRAVASTLTADRIACASKIWAQKQRTKGVRWTKLRVARGVFGRAPNTYQKRQKK